MGNVKYLSPTLGTHNGYIVTIVTYLLPMGKTRLLPYPIPMGYDIPNARKHFLVLFQ